MPARVAAARHTFHTVLLEIGCSTSGALILTGEQIDAGLLPTAVLAQGFEQLGRERHVAIAQALPTTDMDDHALTVDIAHLQQRCLGAAHPGGVEHHQKHAMHAVRCRLDQSGYKSGTFTVWRITAKKRMVAKLKAIKAELQRRMHDRMTEVGAWLRKVVLGYYQYHAVPGNTTQLRIFKLRVCSLWQSVLIRRGQRARMRWERFTPVSNRWIPPPAFCTLTPTLAFTPLIPRKNRMRRRARTDLCGGRSVMSVPTATCMVRRFVASEKRK